MKRKDSLAHIDYLRVGGKDSCEAFCGSDQEWHWVTIVAIYTEGLNAAEIDICDEGKKKQINLGLWLETVVFDS